MEVFKGNTYFRGLNIPIPESTVSQIYALYMRCNASPSPLTYIDGMNNVIDRLLVIKLGY